MGNKTERFILILIVCFACQTQLVAQDDTNTQPLAEVLETLEDRYQVQFNYAQDSIENVVTRVPSEDLTLAEVLAFLEQETDLNFKLSNNFVLVSKRNDIILCGYLLDKDNLSPLENATIQGLSNSTISGDNGFFQLKIQSANEQIVIRYLGYKTITRSYTNFTTDDCANVYLTPFFQSLEEVVIQNYIVKGINKMNDGSYTLNFKDFDILPGLIDADVLQSVQAFPGIQSINETVSNINIRGGTHDQNLILWDNIKMYQSGHFFGLISMYNPQITQKVSLLKNGSDVKYTDGVSGTISMETEKNLNTAFNGNIGINLIDVNGFADVPIGKKSSVQIAARKAISDFLETPTYDKFFDRISQDTELANNTENIINSDQSFDFYDASFRWIYKISDSDELRLNFITVDNELRFDENAILSGDNESRTSSLSQNSIAGALYYNRIWNNKWESTFEAYETDYKLKAINVNIPEEQRFLQENKVSETSLKLNVKHQLMDRLHVNGGYHFVETQVTNLDDVDVPL
ncbi:MAG: TonB-dependent receptor plug domain-containing protein, partial [Flavobacteriaceae bacterium]|nr:TonB-dependent receptor plug domain-containing protein [Flavobacteriaceae bacterium]